MGTECYGSKDVRNDQPCAGEELQVRADDAKAGQDIIISCPAFQRALRGVSPKVAGVSSQMPCHARVAVILVNSEWVYPLGTPGVGARAGSTGRSRRDAFATNDRNRR